MSVNMCAQRSANLNAVSNHCDRVRSHQIAPHRPRSVARLTPSTSIDSSCNPKTGTHAMFYSKQAQRQTRHRCNIAKCTSSATNSAPVKDAEAKFLFPKLDGKDFRHPLDQQNTAVLQLLPGVEELFKAFTDGLAERVTYLENISTAVLVGPDQLPDIYALLQEAAEVLDLETTPDLYIRQNSQPNAYTLAISGKKPFIVVHTALVELLTAAELQAVLGHELGHLKCNHGIWLTVSNLLALSVLSLPGGQLVTAALEDGLMRWVRSAEFTCDRAALLVAQDPKVVASVLMKLAGGSPKLAAALNVDAFIAQARSYDDATSDPVGYYMRNAQTRQLSHPLPVIRAREINQWADSTEYKAILRKGVRGEPTSA